MSQDLERRIANYYKLTGHETEIKYRVRPDKDTQGELYLLENNEEGDICYTYDVEDYSIYDEGEWHDLPKLKLTENDGLTKKDVTQALEESIDEMKANQEEIIDAILKGVAAANEQ